jgi:hypothetical protein
VTSFELEGGSLLTDLLNDVKQSVAQEVKDIESETERRARERRCASARSRRRGRLSRS